MPDGDDLDRKIDAALSTYASPAPGFEDRLLRSIASSERSNRARRRMGFAWAVTLPAAACVVIAVMLVLHVRQPHRSAIREARTDSTALPAIPAETKTSVRVSTARPHRATLALAGRSAASTSERPKRDIFPTPQPLNQDEQALVQYVASAPEEDRRALLAAQTQLDHPIEISAIRIAPINLPDHAGNQGEP